MPKFFGRKGYLPDGTPCIIPTTEDTKAMIANLDPNTVARIEAKQPRNIQHHKLYWAICGEIAENSEIYNRSDDVHEALMVACGRYKKHYIVLPDGSVQVTLNIESISFAAKDQAAFKEYFEQAMDQVAIMGFDLDELTERNE